MPLPKIRFSSLPQPVWEHILAHVEERQISLQDLRRLQDWVNAGPWAPEGDWYKDFGSFTICGSRVSEDCTYEGHGAVWDSNRIEVLGPSGGHTCRERVWPDSCPSSRRFAQWVWHGCWFLLP